MVDESELVETDCPYCAELFIAVNLQACFMCNRVERACAECLKKHEATHTSAEVEAFKREMFDDPPLTTRERINLELKQQIRSLAETVCKVIDDQEEIAKKYEAQCRVLAAEVDRLTPAS